MFGAEPQEKWTVEEAAEFKKHVAQRHRKTLKQAAYAAAALLINILCIIPFSLSHSLHRYVEPVGRGLVILAMALFLWFVLKVGAVWASWQAARETRREFSDPE